MGQNPFQARYHRIGPRSRSSQGRARPRRTGPRKKDQSGMNARKEVSPTNPHPSLPPNSRRNRDEYVFYWKVLLLIYAFNCLRLICKILIFKMKLMKEILPSSSPFGQLSEVLISFIITLKYYNFKFHWFIENPVKWPYHTLNTLRFRYVIGYYVIVEWPMCKRRLL